MGWFSGWFGGSSKPSNNNEDPLRDLDPSLRDFLAKESPTQYQTTAPPPPPPQPSSTISQNPNNIEKEQKKDPSAPPVPPESLFQDGRYAHLWKNYRSRADIECEQKSDQEKLMDVLDHYKARKARIGKAALENCTLEQQATNDCYMTGTWGDTFTMCRPQNMAFNRCYTMQAVHTLPSPPFPLLPNPKTHTPHAPTVPTPANKTYIQRFLKALGYLSATDRDPQIDEEIQMHADKLYHTMLARERAVSLARASNAPIPQFPPLFTSPTHSPHFPHSPNTTTAPYYRPHPSSPAPPPIPASTDPRLQNLSYEQAKTTYLKSLRPEIRPALERDWDRKGLTAEEKMVEARALAMEAEAGIETADEVGGMIREAREKRRERRRRGEAGWGDWVSGWFGH
ncbi:MAG: hypothetical protein L6R37_000007 [Teloschistes peruensis]|nr:MAG: hypothetical protein L6R37_000007 [Teloschistes peruensis]